MIVTRRTLDTLLLSTLASLIVIDGGLLIARRQTKQATVVQDARSFFRNAGVNSSLQLPSGFAENGSSLKLSDSTQLSGILVRYASRTCHWCQVDQPSWNAIAQKALQRHYKIIIVTPSAGVEYPISEISPPQAEQLTFVNLQWLANLRLHGTPTTLISGANNELLWGHEGELTNEDVKLATAIIQKSGE